jgi:hypothetical protein
MHVYISREKAIYLVIEKGKINLNFLNYEIIDNFFLLQRYKLCYFMISILSINIT